MTPSNFLEMTAIAQVGILLGALLWWIGKEIGMLP